MCGIPQINSSLTQRMPWSDSLPPISLFFLSLLWWAVKSLHSILWALWAESPFSMELNAYAYGDSTAHKDISSSSFDWPAVSLYLFIIRKWICGPSNEWNLCAWAQGQDYMSLCLALGSRHTTYKRLAPQPQSGALRAGQSHKLCDTSWINLGPISNFYFFYFIMTWPQIKCFAPTKCAFSFSLCWCTATGFLLFLLRWVAVQAQRIKRKCSRNDMTGHDPTISAFVLFIFVYL